jgi:hypothetical protein
MQFSTAGTRVRDAYQLLTRRLNQVAKTLITWEVVAGAFYETAMRQPPSKVHQLIERCTLDEPALPPTDVALCCEAVCFLVRTYPSAHDQGLLPAPFLAQHLAAKKGKPLDRNDAAKAAESALFKSLADAAHDFWQVRRHQRVCVC